MKNTLASLTTILAFTGTLVAADGIRVVTWNITYYDGTRSDQIGTVCYGTWEGKQLDPDIICLQEMTGRVPTLQFVQALNQAPGSPSDWAAAPIYTNPGGGLHTALVYRTSKLQFVEAELVAAGGGSPQQPRNVVRFDMRAIGYDEEASMLSFFPLHYKAGYSPSDLARKLVESEIVRSHIETLPEDRHIILGADLNIRHSTDPAYEELNGIIPNTGVLWDPISAPGTWNNNSSFRNIHTQDPTGGGGMDDRLDQILLSPSLLNNRGFNYDGAFPTPWDLSTTEDPNHSHRAWGNDGTRYNQSMRVEGNQMVGTEIAQAIADLADPDGHIPVYLDLDVAPRIRVVGETQDLGPIRFDEARTVLLRVGNDGDLTLWGSEGISPLKYSFTTTGFVEIPYGDFESLAGTQLQNHLLTLNADHYPEPGEYVEKIVIVSDDPGTPSLETSLRFEISGCNPADLASPLGDFDFFDVSAFLCAYISMDTKADLAAPFDEFNFFDVSAFLELFGVGCP